MCQQQPSKKLDSGQAEELNPLIQCANLILPWLTPQELANTSITCKTLSQISKHITLRRSLDASRSLENRPIRFHNQIDDHQYTYFLYTSSLVLPHESPPRQPWGCPAPNWFGGYSAAARAGASCGCDCEGCGEEGGFELVWGLEEIGIMRECGASCGCGLECRNRSTQRGISVNLKIVKDRRKGWGLFANEMILQGQFICEYAGEVVTTEEARRRQQIYDELTSAGRFSSALLVVREHLPSGKACLRMNIDATRVGNVARFINHSCDGGNLSTILVRAPGAILPRLCFFASTDIKEDEELTFSYGETRVRTNGLQCHCGSSCCQGSLPSEHT